MAVLEKIRVKLGVFISVLIALALLSFIIDPSTLESALNSMSKKYDVGTIAGKRISYTDFQENVDKFTRINEFVQGSSAQSEETQRQIRNAAWQDMLDRYMFLKNAKEAGISVGEDELLSLMSVNNPSPVIAANPLFMDETGAYSPDMLREFVNYVSSDETGTMRLYWDYLQNSVYTQQYYQKYGALFNASNYENALQLASDIDAGNTSVNIDYVFEYYPFTPDSTVEVSADEIRQYYDRHKKLFTQNASREMEYVVFEVVPSSDDINETSLALDVVYDEFTTTDNMKAFLLKNSDTPLSEYWYKEGELSTVSPELDTQIFGEDKEYTQVVRSGNTFYAARTMDTRRLPDSVYVKHILLQGSDADHVADSLVTVLRRGENFSNLAARYSADQGSAADGELGNIGWMTQTYMIPGMESVIEAKVGTPFTLKTAYGTHVVLVSDATRPVLKKQVAVLEKTALASKETYNSYYSQASTFASLTDGTYEGYERAVDSTKVYSHSLTVTEATSSYGAIDDAKAVTRWVFENKPGKASGIITVNNNYFFVATVKKVNKEGIAPLEDVVGIIQNNLYTLKLQEKTLSDVKARIAGLDDISVIADTLGLVLEHNDALSLSSGTVDVALLGAASVAPEGRIFGPVKASMGVYVLKVNDREKGSFYTEDDARSAALQKTMYSSQFIIPVMSQYDEVKDNRERFY